MVVAPTIDAGFGENCAVFMQPLSKTERFSSHILVLLHSSIPYILYSSQCHNFYQNYLNSDCEPFLEIILLTFRFLSLPLDD
jgi:hypothetical protein